MVPVLFLDPSVKHLRKILRMIRGLKTLFCPLLFIQV